MTQFCIRPATAADIPAILGLITELAEFEKLSHLMSATEQGLYEGMFGPDKACETIVGVEAGKVVAYALFFHNFSTFLARRGIYLEDLYVKESHRRRGYGKTLLIELARIAVERGCARFEWSVLDWNENAIRFYQGMGAEVMPDWRVCRVSGTGLTTLAALGTR